MPKACRNTLLLLPENRTTWLWGWPHRFIERMNDVGTDVFVVRTSDRGWILGVDSAADLDAIAGDHYQGGVWTDRIEVIGSLVR